LQILAQQQEAEKQRCKCGLQIALSLGKQDAGNDHMKDKVESEWVFNPTGKVQYDRQKDQVSTDLKADYSPYD
jgi:hypothetical protein